MASDLSTADLSTLDGLVATLEAAPDAALVFLVEGRPLGAGFHVTEMKSAALTSVDCGRGAHAWRETVVQLLDGADAVTPMTAGKLARIARAALEELPSLADGALQFEAAPGNAALRKLSAARVDRIENRLEVSLEGASAVCKPAARSGCCAPASPTAASAGQCRAG